MSNNGTVPSPGKAYHKFIKPYYPCIGRTVLHKFLPELSKYSDLYRISHCKLTGSDWLEATTYIRCCDGINTRGRLIIWMKSHEGLVYDDVPYYEVGCLHGFARTETQQEITEMTDDELNLMLKKSLVLASQSSWYQKGAIV